MSTIVSTLGLIAALNVITAANPVHAVFFLVLVFTFTSLLRLRMSMEFMALVFLMVYVGAIAVLFLFVVRRLNVQPDVKERPLGNVPMLVGVGGVFLFVILSVNTIVESSSTVFYNDVVVHLDRVSNMSTIGQVLYTTYCVEFLLAGVVLLVSRIGAVVLTQSYSGTTLTPALRQQVHQQHSRDSQRAIFKIH